MLYSISVNRLPAKFVWASSKYTGTGVLLYRVRPANTVYSYSLFARSDLQIDGEPYKQTNSKPLLHAHQKKRGGVDTGKKKGFPIGRRTQFLHGVFWRSFFQKNFAEKGPPVQLGKELK